MYYHAVHLSTLFYVHLSIISFAIVLQIYLVFCIFILSPFFLHSSFHVNLSIVVVGGVDLILSRVLYLAFSASLGLLCMPHACIGPLV